MSVSTNLLYKTATFCTPCEGRTDCVVPTWKIVLAEVGYVTITLFACLEALFSYIIKGVTSFLPLPEGVHHKIDRWQTSAKLAIGWGIMCIVDPVQEVDQIELYVRQDGSRRSVIILS